MNIIKLKDGAAIALVSLAFSFSSLAFAHNDAGIVQAATLQVCQYHFAEDGHRDELAGERQAVKENIVSKINQRVSLMFGPDGETKPILVRDMFKGPDGTMTNDLAAGMTELFSHEILSNASDTLHTYMQKLAERWMDARKRSLEVQFKEYGARRQEELRTAKETRLEPGAGNETLVPAIDPTTGFFTTAYIQDHQDFLIRVLNEMEKKHAGTIEAFKQKPLKQQELQLKKYLMDRTASLSERVHSELREFKRDHQRNAFEEGKKLIKSLSEERTKGITTQLEISRFYRFLFDAFDKYKAALQEIFPLPQQYLEEPELLKWWNLPKDIDQSVALNANKEFEVNLPQGVATGVYFNSLAAVGVILNPPTPEMVPRNAMVVNLHGCGTDKSTAASFLRLQPVAAKCGYHSRSYNLPGAAGENGVGLNSIQEYREMGGYMELLNWHTQSQSLRPNMPLVVYGRSMGSTMTFGNLVAAQKLGYTPYADVSLMMSFSNPNTLSQQIVNVYAQQARGDITDVREDALHHSKWYAKDLQAHVPSLPADQVPLRHRQIQSTFVFVQGEGDEDGIIPGSDKPISVEVDEYRDEHSPFSPIYIFEDPLAEFKVNGVIPGVNAASLEAMHFLASTREDMTAEDAMKHPFFSKLPPHLWPQLGSQTKELYGIPWATLDYLIDFCPYTHPKQRERLRQARLEATGVNRPFAYLEQYVERTINAKVDPAKRKTLRQIVADPSIKASRESGIYGRMKKLHKWVLDEMIRVTNLASQTQEDPNTPIIRLWEVSNSP